MKTRLFLLIGLSFWFSLVYGQLFQKQVSIPGNYFHDLNIEKLEDGSHDMMVAGALFDYAFSNPQICMFRFDEVSGNVVSQRTYNPASSSVANPRILDMVRYTENNVEMLAVTGSVEIGQQRYVMLIKINPLSGTSTGGAFYSGVVPNVLNAQGLHVIFTQMNNQPGFVIGGFANDDYNLTTGDPHTGFVLRTDINLTPVWTTEIYTTPGNANFDYDMVNHITETSNGYFITGGCTGVIQNNTMEGVLAVALDAGGNLIWDNSYIEGNARDVGVDAWFDAQSNEIYLLVNYSHSHYFGITVYDAGTGAIDFSKTWRAYDWSDLNKYGMSLQASVTDTGNLVIAGYDRDADWLDENGNFVSSQTVPFLYEFEKATGDQVGMSYLYHVPFMQPLNDYFNFFNWQMPLIYYPDILESTGPSNVHYYQVGYRTQPASGETMLELIQADATLMNACANSPQNFSHQPIQVSPVPVYAVAGSPAQNPLSMVQSVNNYVVDSCNRQQQRLDYGDAPEAPDGSTNYQTYLANNGARHLIVPSIHMGPNIDGEADGQPNAAADCDDNDCVYPSGGDDEDGVSLPATTTPGATVGVSVTVSVDGFLDAWMDFNTDGDWYDAGEHIFVSQFVTAGVNALSFAVPATASSGQSYLRFRFRDYSAPLKYYGLARNGEVEDYTMEIKPVQQDNLDFGDAPEDAAAGFAYPTTLAANGARHVIDADIFLGAKIDPEADGQPSNGAVCDDNDCVYPSAGDDEDGVMLPANGNIGSVVPITVTASVNGYLDAWMDFNLDGDWADAGEHIFNIYPLSAGTNSLSISVPSTATPGQSYLRFRFRNFKAPISFKGLVDNGEVEDYMMDILESPGEQLDFGDAPQEEGTTLFYPTTSAVNGAAHYINPDIYLGNKIDGEPDGQPSVGADCDDNDCLYTASGDDEDGVILPGGAVAGSTVTITVTASVAGFLDAWMDFNQNGDWSDAGEHIFNIQPLSSGANALNFNIPASAAAGQTYLRFRFRTFNAPISFKGLVDNGEVEDYRMFVEQETGQGIDFGDAPDSPYPTTMASNGARHFIDGITYLGNLIDAEANGQQSPNAKGDDALSLDDEDGVEFVNKMVIGKMAKVNVLASVDGYLNTWMDFDKNGSWADAGEHVFNNVLLTAGWNSLSFPIPADAKKGGTFIRFRFNTEGGLSYDGPADNGEVEDYRVRVCPDWIWIPTNISHLIAIPNPTFPLNPGDEIGVFYTDNAGVQRCAGMIEWTGEDNQVLTAFGDDPTTPDIKEGFAAGEIIHWKICFDAVPVVIDDPVVIYDPELPNHDGKFEANGLSAIAEITGLSVEATAEPQQVCAGEPVQLQAVASGGGNDVFYSWTSEPAGFTSTLPNPVVYPTENTTYHVEATDGIFNASAGVSVEVLPPLTVNAGTDATLCGETQYLLNGDASNYSALEWTTSGDGEFEDPTSAQTLYFPGTEDLMLATVILTLHAEPQQPCTLAGSDNMVLSVFDAQDIPVKQGWSGISAALAPADNDLPTLLSPISDQLILIYNLTGMYWPAQGISTLTAWDAHQGYIVKSTGETVFSICGNTLMDQSVSLNPAWNVVPVLCKSGADVVDVFGSLSGMTVVKQVAGPGVYWPYFNVNTIGTLMGGKSYFAYTPNGGQISYSGKCTGGFKAAPKLPASPWNAVAESPVTHVVAITEGAASALQPGDIIGAFTASGLCAGYALYTGQATAMVLNGNISYATGQEGFDENEPIDFRVYRPETVETYALDVVWDESLDHSGAFHANGLSAITNIKVSTLGMEASENQTIHIWPNPSDGTIHISGIGQETTVEIFDAWGERVFRKTHFSEKLLDLRKLPKGVYVIYISNSRMNFNRKLVIQ